MNEKVLRHKNLRWAERALRTQNHDYGDSFHTTFVEEGLAMAVSVWGISSPASRPCPAFPAMTATSSKLRMSPFVIRCSISNYAIMTVLEMDTPDESHATLYAYDKPIYTVEEDK